MSATKVQLIGGNFQDNEGNVLALGYLLMRLSSDELVSGVGELCAGIVTRITLNSSGSVDTTTPQYVWGNDQMTPANSFYIVEGFAANGQLAWGPNNQQVIGSGGTFDVGTWIPNTVLSWFYPALLGPTGPTGPGGSGATGPTGPAGASSPAQSFEVLGNLHGMIANADSGQFTGLGTTPGSAIGTYANLAPTSTAGPAIQITSAAIPNGQGVLYNNNQTGLAIGPLKYWQAGAKISAGSGSIWYAGMNDVNPGTTLMPSTLTTQNAVTFRWVTGNANWQCVVCNGAGTETAVDSGVAVDTNFHLFQIFPTGTGTSVTFKIDGVTVATITTHLPSASLSMGSVITLQSNALTQAIQYVWWSY